MDFAAYLRESRRSGAEVARQIGVDATYVSHLRAGRRYPSLKLAAKISEATSGMVTFNDWIAAKALNPRPWKPQGDD